MTHFGASLTDNSKVIIYYHNIFIGHRTDKKNDGAFNFCLPWSPNVIAYKYSILRGCTIKPLLSVIFQLFKQSLNKPFCKEHHDIN